VILYLIKRDNIDIYDIPIAKITRDYLEYLDIMDRLQIDLAGEADLSAIQQIGVYDGALLVRSGDELAGWTTDATMGAPATVPLR